MLEDTGCIVCSGRVKVRMNLAFLTDEDNFSGSNIAHSGPQQPLLPQNTYGIEHKELGTLSIFIVPIGLDAEGMRYEAVFA